MKILNSFLILLLSSSLSYAAERDKEQPSFGSNASAIIKSLQKQEDLSQSKRSNASFNFSEYEKKSKTEEDLKHKLHNSEEQIKSIIKDKDHFRIALEKKNNENEELKKYRRERSIEFKKILEEKDLLLKTSLEEKKIKFKEKLKNKKIKLKKIIEENIQLKLSNTSLSTKVETLLKIVDPTLEKLAKKLEREEQLEKERIAQEEIAKFELWKLEEKKKKELLEQEEKNRIARIEYEKRRKLEEEKRIENEINEKIKKEEEEILKEINKKIEEAHFPYSRANTERGDIDNRRVSRLAMEFGKDDPYISDKIRQAYKDGTIYKLLDEFGVPDPIEEKQEADKKRQESISFALSQMKEIAKKAEELEFKIKEIHEKHGKKYEPKKIKVVERTREERDNKDRHILYKFIRE